MLKLDEKINNQINTMKKEQDDITNTIIDDIINLSFENINIHYNSKYLSLDEIEIEIKKIKEIIIPKTSDEKGKITTLKGLSIGGAGVGGVVAVNITATAGFLLAVSLGLVGGISALSLIGGISYIIGKFKKTSKYIEALTSYKNHIINKFEDMVKTFENDFEIFKNSLLKRLDILCDLLYTKLDDNEMIKKWENIKSEYEKIKENTKNLIDNKFN